MFDSLLDVPRCLRVDACYVGTPAEPIIDRGGSWPALGAALDAGGTAAFRRRAVHECLDTAAVLRAYREPLDGETWTTPAESEQRLLAQISAIVALGRPALKQVADLALDHDLPDPGRVFAALLVFGCVHGAKWATTARDIFVQAVVRNPQEMAAAVEASCLGANDDIAHSLAPFLRHEHPLLRASVVRVLAFRGALKQKDWHAAICDPDTQVVAAAAAAPLQSYARDHCEPMLLGVLIRQKEQLTRSVLQAGVALASAAVHDHAVQIARSDPSWANALQCVAMFGSMPDARLIAASLDGSQPLAALHAAGTLGAAALTPDLLALAECASVPEVQAAARHAAERITALGFGQARDSAECRRLWASRARGFDVGVRYRAGRPFGTGVLRDQLNSGPHAREHRQQTYLELVAATEGRVPRFSAYDFVGAQRRALRRIDEWLAPSSVVTLRSPHG
jgi:hypothetical protein